MTVVEVGIVKQIEHIEEGKTRTEKFLTFFTLTSFVVIVVNYTKP